MSINYFTTDPHSDTEDTDDYAKDSHDTDGHDTDGRDTDGHVTTEALHPPSTSKGHFSVPRQNNSSVDIYATLSGFYQQTCRKGIQQDLLSEINWQRIWRKCPGPLQRSELKEIVDGLSGHQLTCKGCLDRVHQLFSRFAPTHCWALWKYQSIQLFYGNTNSTIVIL